MGEENQLKFDFEDRPMMRVRERLELGLIFKKLPIIDKASYKEDIANGQMRICLIGWSMI